MFSRYEIKTWKFDRYSGEVTSLIVANLQVLMVVFIGSMTWSMVKALFAHYLCSSWCSKDDDDRASADGEGFWTAARCLELAIMASFWCSFGLFVHNYHFEDGLVALFDAQPPFQSFRRLQLYFEWESWCGALSGLLLWLKMFKYLSFHPKFNFLFAMFWRRIQDLVMFGTVLAVFYLVFAVSGFLVFNSDVADFRSYDRSLISVDLFMIGGIDRVQADLAASSPIIGWLFYFCWIVIMGLVLVNVFIAILVESYAKTAEELGWFCPFCFFSII